MRIPALGNEARPPTSANLVPLIVAALVALTIATGLVAKAFGVYWGAPAQPLLVRLQPDISIWFLLTASTLALSLMLALRMLRIEASPGLFALGLFGLALLTRVALNIARFGPHELYSVYAVQPVSEGRLEYLAALTELKQGLGPVLDNFASLVATLPLHPAGHPPGLLVLIDLLGITTPQALAVLTITVGAVAAPLLYWLGQELFDERTARVASLLLIFVPTSLLYGATTADALYATLALLAATLMLSRRRLGIAFGAIFLAVASFFSYALPALGGWAGLVKWRRDGFIPMLRLALLCGAVLAGFYLLLAWSTGFDVVGSILATHDRYYKGVASARPYLFYLFGSPAAFLFMLGPVAWFASRSLGSREITALALFAVIVVSVLTGYTKAETERIWLYLVPLACLTAARALPDRYVKPVLIALLVQAVLFELLLDTLW